MKYSFVIIVCAAVAVSETLAAGHDEQMSADALMRRIMERMSVLEARDKRQQQQIDIMSQQIDELRLELTSKDQAMKHLRGQIKEKDRNVSKLIRKCLQNGTDASIYSRNHSVTPKESSGILEAKNRIRRTETEVKVAFTAGLSHSILHAGEHQNIVFDHVETNIGNSYNPHHGVFVAPVSGTYMFYMSVMAEKDREVYCQIVVNGRNKATAYARGDAGRYDQGSQAVVVHLQAGDDVAVQNYLPDDGIFSSGDFWTTFSGFLLYEG